jgi:hypothetical protein
MADTPRKAVRVDEKLATGTITWKWEGLDGDDTGIPVMMAKHPDMSYQAYSLAEGGAWGDATLTLEGTHDPRGNPDHADHANAKWVGLTDTTETTISQTADSTLMTQILQKAFWVRPKTAGGTATNLVVLLNGTVRG